MHKISIIYKSITGNTKQIADSIAAGFTDYPIEVNVVPLDKVDMDALAEQDGFIIGTYTWGNGELPDDVKELYMTLDRETRLKKKITGVFGSGDTNYPHFCRAVDLLADLLAVKTTLILKMKIELDPQNDDLVRCKRFAARYAESLLSKGVAAAVH